MTTFLFFILGAFLVAGAWAPFLIHFLFKFNIRRRSKEELDNKVSNHAKKTGTPVMGGILIVVTVLVLNLIFNRATEIYPLLFLLIAGGVLGAVDDLFNAWGHKLVRVSVRKGITPIVSSSGVSWRIYKLVLVPWNAFKEAFRAMGSYRGGFKAHEKFLIQCAISGVASWWLVRINGALTLWLPLFGDLDIGWAYPLLALFLMITFSNAFSITDGLDGLSGGTHAIAFFTLGMIGLVQGQTPLALFAATLVGSELAFLYFNIKPARFQMSDVGTLPLGMVYALLGFLLHREIVLFVVGGVFLVEIASSFFQVWSVKLRGKRIFKIAPIHHHFEALGWPEAKITERFWLVGALLSIAGFALALF